MSARTRVSGGSLVTWTASAVLGCGAGEARGVGDGEDTGVGTGEPALSARAAALSPEPVGAEQGAEPCFGPPEGAMVIEPVAWRVRNRIELEAREWQGVTLEIDFANRRVSHWSVANLNERVSSEVGGCWGEIDVTFPPDIPSAYQGIYTYSGALDHSNVPFVDMFLRCGLADGEFIGTVWGTWSGYGANLMCFSEISPDRVAGAALLAALGRFYEAYYTDLAPFYVAFDFHPNAEPGVHLQGARVFTWRYDGLTAGQAWDPEWWETQYGNRTTGGAE